MNGNKFLECELPSLDVHTANMRSPSDNATEQTSVAVSMCNNMGLSFMMSIFVFDHFHSLINQFMRFKTDAALRQFVGITVWIDAIGEEYEG